MKKIKIIIFFCLALITIGINPFIVDAASKVENPLLVRVGYNEYDVSFVDKNGYKRGYLFDYLKELQRYGNFKYEFIKADHNKQENLLNNKKLDLIFFETKKRAEIRGLEISSLPWSNVKGVLCILEKNKNKYGYEDFKKFEGLKVGYLENSENIYFFNKYAKNNNFSTKLFPFENIKKIHNALISGNIDACFIRIMGDDLGFKTIGKINTPVDFIASYKNSNVLKKVDIAMRKLAFYEPEIPVELFRKYFLKQTATEFTKAEQDLIAKNEKIVVAIRQGKRPLNYIKNGVSRGIVPNIIKEIAKTSGLNFEYKIFGRDATVKEIEADNDVDFLVVDKLFQKPGELEKCSFPFYEDNFMTVVKLNTDIELNKLNKIALIERQKNHIAFFSKWWKDEELITFKSIKDVLNAVENQEVNLGIILESRGRYLLKSPYYKDLFLTGLKDEVISLALKEKNPSKYKYLSIINKSIEMLKANKGIKIVLTNVEAEAYDLSIAEFVYNYSVPIFLAILLMALLIALYFREYKQNDTLNEANKKAEAANIAKSQFLANMSHELRTPLNAVIGLNYLLKDSLNNYELAKDYVDKMKESSKILLSIINDILDMSAIESGKLTLANEKFNIKDSVYAVTELYYAQCVEKGVLYESRASLMKHEILIGDNFRLSQVVINVLSNAVKFTERGGKIKLDLIEEEISDKKSILKIIISDTGVCMSEEFQKRLFGEFEQEDATTVRNYGGSGLGLAICKRIVDLMKGEILVESKLGIGTTVTIEIPIEVGEKVEFKDVNEISNLDILIVDNDLKTCQDISSILNVWNVKNEYVVTESSAIEKVKNRILVNEEYNFYIINLKMPKMNGVELANKIKALSKQEAFKTIVASYDIVEFKAIDENYGADCFLRKPIFPSELFNRIITKLGSNDKFDLNSKTKILLKNMKILLVEDNAINQMIAKKLLEKVGAIVTVAKNGEEALEFVKTNKDKFDVILMDIQMPIMNGYEATKKIRAINSSYTNNLPIYSMTANSFHVDVENELAAGMDGHISKPIEPEVLFRILSELKKN